MDFDFLQMWVEGTTNLFTDATIITEDSVGYVMFSVETLLVETSFGPVCQGEEQRQFAHWTVVEVNIQVATFKSCTRYDPK